mmetsp:Transcript_77032/g.225933  ORF Transcript_77032/g.225933 Transcript_77032/m.225933 type:complete len:559 (+) Transcript_77032:105-1781(+)
MAEAFTYIPREELCSPPARPTHADGICIPCLKAKEKLAAGLRRWWYVTTDRDFLVSSASRRNSWKVLLPVPGLLAMLTDAGFKDLVIVDAYATVALLLMACLPPGMLWSDLAISLVHALFYFAHSLARIREQRALHKDGMDCSGMFEPGSCQVLSVFAMASAGVHSTALASFNVLVAAASYFLHSDTTIEELVACIYIMAAASFAERRLAQLVFDAQGSDFRYKALMDSGDQDSLLLGNSPRHSVEKLVPGAEGALHSDGEESLESVHTHWHLRASLTHSVNSVLAHLKPQETSQRLSRMLSRSRPRFAAAQVQAPAAAMHEAPSFVELLDIPAAGLNDSCYSYYSPSAPSMAESSDAQTVPMLAASEDLEQPYLPRMPSHPPVSPPPLDQPAVLRGIKMHGFHTPQLNTLFIESRDDSSKVDNRETYWTEANDYFLYHSKATDTWGLAKGRRFQAVINGTSNGVAHSPEGYEVWCSKGRRGAAQGHGSWREWDTNAGKWLPRPNSGVESRGRVRPKALLHELHHAGDPQQAVCCAPPVEKAVQTEPSVKDQQCQTDH